jgi:hypothetical protein
MINKENSLLNKIIDKKRIISVIFLNYIIIRMCFVLFLLTANSITISGLAMNSLYFFFHSEESTKNINPNMFLIIKAK